MRLTWPTLMVCVLLALALAAGAAGHLVADAAPLAVAPDPLARTLATVRDVALAMGLALIIITRIALLPLLFEEEQ